jgi:hypothetical protein
MSFCRRNDGLDVVFRDQDFEDFPQLV